jgi:hypothetical protein
MKVNYFQTYKKQKTFVSLAMRFVNKEARIIVQLVRLASDRWIIIARFWVSVLVLEILDGSCNIVCG